MTFAGLSRRGFLGASAAGLGIMGVAAAGWDWFGPGEAHYRALVGDAVPTVLSVKELAILGALAETVITTASGAPTVQQAETARRIDRELSFQLESQLVSDVKLSLAFLEHLPVVDFLGLHFTSLSTADKIAFLENCGTSSWSARSRAFAGLKFLILFFYYTDDRTWPSIGYGGPQVAEKFFEGGNSIANLPAIAGHTGQGG